MARSDEMNDEPIHSNHNLQRKYPANIKFCPLCGGEMELRVVLPDRKRLKACTKCGFVHYPQPKLVAGCLVVDAGRALLLRRGNEPRRGKWTFPGGYVDFGETMTEAALRETREEVGMRVRIGEILGIYCDPKHPSPMIAVYLAAPGDDAPQRSEEALEIRYFKPEELPWKDIAFHSTEAALRDWMKGL
jgi:ADP-ribose pyrophosphatase YjhB (NUDIX family)